MSLSALAALNLTGIASQTTLPPATKADELLTLMKTPDSAVRSSPLKPQIFQSAIPVPNGKAQSTIAAREESDIDTEVSPYRSLLLPRSGDRTLPPVKRDLDFDSKIGLGPASCHAENATDCDASSV